MARSASEEYTRVYEAAERWVDAALCGDDSLFTPGEPLWSPRWLSELHERFVEQPDESSDRFEVKLERQLADASPDAIQLMGEVLYVHFLVASSSTIRGETKRDVINTVLSWSPKRVQIPPDLHAALEHGPAGAGTAFNTRRPFHLQFVIETLRAWKALDSNSRYSFLHDPWRFREFLFSQPLPPGAHSQREALLHIVHPETFEAIVSRGAKQRIVKAFSEIVTDPSRNVDQQLFEIRQRLSEEYGRDFHFWQPEVLPQWQPDTSLWGQFIHWLVGSVINRSLTHGNGTTSWRSLTAWARPETRSAVEASGLGS